MVIKALFPLFLVCFAVLSLVSPVYGASPIPFPDLPDALANQTGISVFACQILFTVIVELMFLLPLNATKRGSAFLPNIILGLGTMVFTVAIGWCPYWVLLLVCLVIAVFWGMKVSKIPSVRG